jgi:PST family polysaccharide transporter
VALPALSSLQNQGEKFRDFYTKYLFILAFFSMPVVVYLGVFADELIFIILGDQWVEAGPLFQILAIAAFIQPVVSTTGLILITTGEVKRYFNIGLINAIFMVSGFGIGVYLGGVRGVAISNVVVVYFLFIPTLYHNLRKSPVSVAQFLKEISIPLLYSVLSGVAMMVYAHYVEQLNLQLAPMVYCALGLVVGAITYLGLMLALPISRKKFMQILNLGLIYKAKRG